MTDSEETLQITESHLRELLSDATKNGIRLGKELAVNDKEVPIDSLAFPAQQLFQVGKQPHLRQTVWDLFDKHNLIAKRWGDPDRSAFYQSDVADMIRKLALYGCNVTRNRDVPIKFRADVLEFYDALAAEWLKFADDHLPYYTKEGEKAK